MGINRENIQKVVREIRREVIVEVYQDVNIFRNKINTLISTTPTGELRNTYTDLNILFEKVINDYEFLIKI